MSADFMTSAVILRDLLERDSDRAWQAFCDRYGPMLENLMHRAGIRDQDAPDVVQETLVAFLGAFRAGRYDASRGRLRAWLKGIAINKIREARRRRGQRERQVADNPQSTAFMNRVPDDNDELEQLFEREWEQAVLAAGMRQVRREVEPKTFAAFKLYAIDGKRPEAVAAELGITREAVYVYKSRVLERLQRWRSEFRASW